MAIPGVPTEKMFSDSAEDMQTRGAVMIALAREFQAVIVLEFPWFTTEFIDSWEADLETAKAFPLAIQITNAIEVLTYDVVTSIVLGYKSLHTLDGHAQHAFKGNEALIRSFAQDQIEDAKTNAAKMVNALGIAFDTASITAFKNALITDGFLLTAINGLSTLAANLDLKLKLQKTGEKKEPISTQQRTQLNNIVYMSMQDANLAVNVVYMDDPAMKNAFRLTKAGGTGTDPTAVNFHFTNSVTGEVISGVTSTTTNTGTPIVKISNVSGDSLFISRAFPATATADHAKAGYVTQSTSSVLELGDVNTINVVLVPAVLAVPFHTVAQGSMANVPNAIITSVDHPAPEPSITNAFGLTTVEVPSGTTNAQFQVVCPGFITQIFNYDLSEGMPEILVVLIPG